MKKILLAFMLIVLVLSSFLPISALSSDNNDNIQVLLNGKRLKFDVEPIIMNGRTLVPLRAIFEAFGTLVEWNDNTKTVIAKQGNNVISIKAGSKTAYFNDKAIELDVPAIILDGRTLVPVRFISESFGYDVLWNESIKTVTINYSATITPTLRPTLPLTNTPTSSEQTKSSFDGNIDKLLGLSSSAITDIFGQANRIDLSKYGFDWHIYNSDYSKYLQIGVLDGLVVAVYTNSTNYSVWETIGVNSAKDSVDNMLGSPLTYIKKGNTRYLINNLGEQEVFDVDGEYFATVFYDKYNSNKVSAIRLIDSEVEMSLKGYYGTPSERLRESFEREIFDLANSVRAKHGKKPFVWDEKAVNAARKHSEDMGLNDYFSHTNLSGKSPFDRMKDAGIKYFSAAENIAMGQMSGIDAHETWMNSSGHRTNILGNCERLGVGVYIGSGNKILYTQNFYTGY